MKAEIAALRAEVSARDRKEQRLFKDWQAQLEKATNTARVEEQKCGG